MEPGVVRTLACFHPANCRVVHLSVETKDAAKVQVGERTYSTVRCEVEQIGVTVWLADDGLLIKGEEGAVTYTLMPPE